MTTAGPRARRLGAGLLLAVLILAVAALVWSRSADPVPPRPAARRPPLMLLTSLPLLFGERFGLDGNGSPALSALETRYRVRPIGVADRASLGGGRLLLMAHPNAQPAQALVDLDQWVRDGGRLLLLADPMLEWPSERPLGDRLRPSPMFMDTGLLAHWGLALAPPETRGPAQRMLGGETITTSSPGRLSGGCTISTDKLVARCRIGRGEAIVVADADFLDVADLPGHPDGNLDALLALLASLEEGLADSPSRR